MLGRSFFSFFNAAFLSDGYKVGHKDMMADNTTRLYGTLIPRSLKYAKGLKKIMAFESQLVWKFIHDMFKEGFFEQDEDFAVDDFAYDMSQYLGLPYDAEHFRALHRLGYLPMRVKALKEGTFSPKGVPHMTFINTKDGFGWLTLYLETINSAAIWKGPTSASIAYQYRLTAEKWVRKTDPDRAFLIPFLCHDFSARGLSPWDMFSSGLGHATCFRGSDTLMVIPTSRYYYGVGKKEMPINSVNASEHSVSCTNIFTKGEKQMVSDWLKKFPNGILSIVMDTLDLTRVVKPEEGGYIYDLKQEILDRYNGDPMNKLVIRPDSSPRTPLEIICGHDEELNEVELRADYPAFYNKGIIQCLWEIFGGTVNAQGYKVLHPCIGAIYGDSITLELQEKIYAKLAEQGFATTNIVLGVGSFTYQYNTRDTLGWAVKGAWFETEDRFGKYGHNIYKDPVTDEGTKKSLKGMICVNEDFSVTEECTEEQENQGLLQLIYQDGEFLNITTLAEIRTLVDAEIVKDLALEGITV